MQKNETIKSGNQPKQPPLMRKFVVFSVALFLIILIAGGFAFILSMREIIRENKGTELSQLLEYKRLMLESSVSGEISIVLMMADSPLIKRYFTDPADPELERMAFDEINAYRNAFSSDTIFWVNDTDRLFYFNDETPYLLDAENPDNYWYYMTLFETDVYNFNINYNPDLNVTNLWINAPVFDQNRNPLGIVGTGIELTVFLDMIFEEGSNTGGTGRSDIYLFNAFGEITGAKDAGLVADKINIEDYLGESGEGILDKAHDLEHDEIYLFYATGGRIALLAVPLLEWYAVAISYDSSDDYDNAMTVLFLVVLAVLAIVFVIFNFFIAGLLRPLHRSMKDVENANRAKTNFLSTMSHEMRTPINVVIGMTTIGKRADTTERKDYAFDKIDSASKHLLGVINDVLDMTKIEANKLELSEIEYDFKQMIQKVLSIINFRIEENEQKFTLYIDGRVPDFVIGDDQHLAQVLMNLLSNAVKFTPEQGDIGLAISVIEEIDGIYEMQFIVSDTGIGISPEQQKKLFSMFVQAESGISREYGGTGLGLAISKHIVELMDGRIWVESELGIGTEFIFTVKLKRGKKNKEKQPAQDFTDNRDDDTGEDMDKQDEIVLIPGEFKGKRLLLVEDIAINREIVIALLEGSELVIDTAENGQEALDILTASPDIYDVIFMDMEMPKMDGLEATRQIRGSILFNGRNVPIIAMTANVFQSDIERCIAAGMNSHIGKPIDIAEVIINLRKYLLI